MSFSIRGHGVAEFEGITLQGGKPGLGFFQLSFEVRMRFWTADNAGDVMTLDIDGGEVLARRQGGVKWYLLGRLHRETGIARSTMVEKQRPVFTWGLALDLPPSGLEALERLRAGGDLDLQVRLLGQVWQHGAAAESGEETRHVTVNQSEWARVLKEIDYRETLLLEVAVVPVDGALHDAAQHLREARDFFQAGQYRKTVEACRHALEALGHELGDGTGTKLDLRAMLDKPDALTKEERLMALRRAGFVMSCLAAHSKDNVSIRTTWDRHDALGMLTMTGSLVHWIAESRTAGV